MPPPAIRHYFVNLDASRSAHLFLYAFALGSASIYFEIFVPVLPIIIVFIYGVILLAATRW